MIAEGVGRGRAQPKRGSLVAGQFYNVLCALRRVGSCLRLRRMGTDEGPMLPDGDSEDELPWAIDILSCLL